MHSANNIQNVSRYQYSRPLFYKRLISRSRKDRDTWSSQASCYIFLLWFDLQKHKKISIAILLLTLKRPHVIPREYEPGRSGLAHYRVGSGAPARMIMNACRSLLVAAKKYYIPNELNYITIFSFFFY